ncbi:tyrosine-type recombinase/integrase [Bacillus sp. AFS041924]|uniref:tyrosine-type recombinase/integrase n=1 Tax=Bacillus sp. AFS041924 TaxID=2033503 RepID=UPI000BFE3B97|nr:tyrosine-type recombinase/integrase [Bacillus sp. AFS041924]PGS55117.1 integrase [Bacillus sp. AFS041924]
MTSQNETKKLKRPIRKRAGAIKPLDADEKLSLLSLFDRFMVAKKAELIAPRTRKDYELHFQYLLRYLKREGYEYNLKSLTVDVFTHYTIDMIEHQGLSPVTANVRIRTTRAFLRWLYNQSYIRDALHLSFKPLRTPQDTIESFTVEEVRAMFRVIDTDTYTGFRDQLVLTMLLDTMVRISELVSIKRENIDLKGKVIKLESKATKTRKTRYVPLSDKTIKLIKEYYFETEDFENEYLLLTYEGEQVNADTLRERIAYIGRVAGIHKRVSPHTFRHTGALMYIMNGGDPFSLQKILGHSDMTMTRRYVQMTNKDVKAQHNRYSPLSSL